MVRRDTGQKTPVTEADIIATVDKLLQEIQDNMFAKAKAILQEKTTSVQSYDEFKKMLEENRLDKLTAAIETSSDDGMLTFNQSLFNLVKAGRVSEKEAMAKASNPQALEMNFKGIFLNEGGRIVG